MWKARCPTRCCSTAACSARARSPAVSRRRSARGAVRRSTCCTTRIRTSRSRAARWPTARARAGHAPRIGGGSARSYFLVLDDGAEGAAARVPAAARHGGGPRDPARRSHVRAATRAAGAFPPRVDGGRHRVPARRSRRSRRGRFRAAAADRDGRRRKSGRRCARNTGEAHRVADGSRHARNALHRDRRCIAPLAARIPAARRCARAGRRRCARAASSARPGCSN